MSKKTSEVTNNRRVNETAEERRIREEELCWRRYAKEKAAEEKEKKAQMDAMFEAHQRAVDGTDEHLDYTIPEERTMRGERRKGTYRSKEKVKKNARTATANSRAREERDKMSGTHRNHGTGEKVNGLKSQVRRTEKLVKRASKIAPET